MKSKVASAKVSLILKPMEKFFPEPRRIENSSRPLLSRQTPSERVREKGCESERMRERERDGVRKAVQSNAVG